MMAVEKYIPIFQNALDDYKKRHPHWRFEVLISLIKWGIRSLKQYVEDPRERNITWDDPFVELHYPVEWNWKARGGCGIVPDGHIYGKITKKNTADKDMAAKTLGKIMAHWFNGTTLSNITNGIWYEKLNNYYTPILPVELCTQLNAIKNKRERRDAFKELVRPFSIGAASIDREDMKFKAGSLIPLKVTKQLAKMYQSLDIKRISISGETNGRKFQMSLVFQIHPLIADYDKKKAYHPITIGLFIVPEFSDRDVVTWTPADWPKNDRELFWDMLLREIGRTMNSLIPKTESQDSIILSVNSKIKIPAAWWRPENRGEAIKRITDLQSQAGDLTGISVQLAESGLENSKTEACPVCGWIHDRGFTQIKTDSREAISLAGILPEIVSLVHRAHEKGFTGLSTKDDALLEVCGGYMNPCQAFDDLNRRDEYKRLFDTRRRGFISLRGIAGRNRNKSEARPE
jgi:hypothetical protein